VHRAQVLQIRGDWAAAAAEADRAYRDMLGVHVGTAAGGQYELAEVLRLQGDFPGAEKAFKRAHELGHDPQPGLALVRLAQGRVDMASASIRSALAGTTAQLQRAPLRIAQVEIALAAGDLDAAEEAASELERTAATYASSGLQAAASGARGSVLQARGQTGEALVRLREACGRWQEIEAPYEAARVRLQLAEAYHSLGDGEAAALELDAAEKVFERLGAAWDSRVVAAMRGGARTKAGLSPREVEVLRLMASGHSNREIASELFLSERTVHRHVSNIFAKLDVSSRAAATAAAYESGLATHGSG
jgi:ATP/maltotriose-dependent transcriptional regulator MalT